MYPHSLEKCTSSDPTTLYCSWGVSSPLGSSTGFPEGCPLSVVAMAVANLACEYWMKHRFPQVQTWSYVDNLETVCKRAEEAMTSLQKLGEFCQLFQHLPALVFVCFVLLFVLLSCFCVFGSCFASVSESRILRAV